MSRAKLVLITGPVQAHKSGSLISQLRKEKVRKERHVMAFRPSSDTRDAGPFLTTQYGEKFSALQIDSLDDIFPAVQSQDSGRVVLGVDEINLLFHQMKVYREDFLATFLDLISCESVYRIYVSGVSLDYRGKPWDPVPDLMALANKRIVLTGFCSVCGSPAEYSHRKTSQSDQVQVGGESVYEARCFRCFNSRYF